MVWWLLGVAILLILSGSFVVSYHSEKGDDEDKATTEKREGFAALGVLVTIAGYVAVGLSWALPASGGLAVLKFIFAVLVAIVVSIFIASS